MPVEHGRHYSVELDARVRLAAMVETGPNGRFARSWTGAGDGRQDAAPCDAACYATAENASEEAEATVIATILEGEKCQPAKQKHMTKLSADLRRSSA